MWRMESGGLALFRPGILYVTLHQIVSCKVSVLVLRGLQVAALLHVWSKQTPEHQQAWVITKNISPASYHSSQGQCCPPFSCCFSCCASQKFSWLNTSHSSQVSNIINPMSLLWMLFNVLIFITVVLRSHTRIPGFLLYTQEVPAPFQKADVSGQHVTAAAFCIFLAIQLEQQTSHFKSWHHWNQQELCHEHQLDKDFISNTPSEPGQLMALGFHLPSEGLNFLMYLFIYFCFC